MTEVSAYGEQCHEEHIGNPPEPRTSLVRNFSGGCLLTLRTPLHSALNAEAGARLDENTSLLHLLEIPRFISQAS